MQQAVALPKSAARSSAADDDPGSSSYTSAAAAPNAATPRADRARTVAQLRAMFAAAVSEVCPRWAPVLDAPHLSTSSSSSSAALFQFTADLGGKRARGVRACPLHDVTCKVATAVFWRAWRHQNCRNSDGPQRIVGSAEHANRMCQRREDRRKRKAERKAEGKRQRKRHRAAGTNTDPPSASSESAVSAGSVGSVALAARTITIVSDYGTHRTLSARELAELLVAALPTHLVASILADVRVAPGNSGAVHLTTISHFRTQGEHGFFLCPTCGHFLRGEQGLWWHQKMNHGNDHDGAKAIAATQLSRMAVVPYAGGENRAAASATAATAGGGTLLPVAKAEAKKQPKQKSRRALAPGIEAARTGDLPALRRIVEEGSWDPALAVDCVHGSPALLWAAGGGHLDVCVFLVEECHADPLARQQSRRSFGGRTALHWAARNGHLNVCAYLVRVMSTSNTTVTRKGSAEPSAAAASGAPVDVATDDGTTAFCWASWQGHLDVMKFLVAAGCNPHLKNKYGCNAAMWAVQGDGGVAECKYLKSLGVAFNGLNLNGHGTVHKAAQRGKREVAEWLLCEEGTITESQLGRDGEGYSPAGLAAVEGHAALAAWLAEKETQMSSKE